MRPLLPLFAAIAALLPRLAHAAPEEIQVYMDELNAPHELGLDVHLNDVPSGSADVDYPGAEPALHRVRITPEFSYGVSTQLEAGLYLPLATIAADGRFRVEGAKARLKWLAPHKAQGFYWGANLEVGRVSHSLDANPWNAELKMIAGWRKGPWVLATNVNFDAVVAGPANGPVSLDIDTKAGYRISKGLMLGLESYNGLGALRAPGAFRTNDQSTFLIADTHIGSWDINAGVGKGYGGNRDDVIVKFVIGVPLPKHL